MIPVKDEWVRIKSKKGYTAWHKTIYKGSFYIKCNQALNINMPNEIERKNKVTWPDKICSRCRHAN